MNVRPSTSKDSKFVYQVKVDALEEYVHETWGWNDEFQEKLHDENFDPSETEIIQFDREDAGFLIIKENEKEIELKEINLLRKFQNRGIGSSIIEEVLDQGRKNGKAVKLQVLKVNPAIKLYKRFGFEIVGETDTHHLMKSNENKAGIGITSRSAIRNPIL